eukprot:CAMPEP_0183297686 /NCGR_PEP_ID=MMETSP0160_2-20130417/4908_1 /TAXON_ID=2839 ORGANISM="Odontella Sinensis, Strain Grunow 1884" /NCGR_SAMPLE_ID=MMETSP0160_2 /ASSEMBLY_ACC=CAM_ASM_000250 /LENGTH=442 /DNA_ID=CAMNT_0025459555 /DNA_START=45 /DNA_END=1373 /DNA_ORIENTATION=-
MSECLLDLGASATEEEIEAWACLIFESMSAPSRTFHSVQHVFDISVDADSIQTLSAFFHDVIYYGIDGGLSQEQSKILHGVISVHNGEDVFLNYIDTDSDRVLSMCMTLFGFKPGQMLDPFHGLNEFLSAAVALRCLEGTLDLHQLAKIATCIEATIPFRGAENGKTATEALHERLKDANTLYGLNLGEEEMVLCIQRAVDLANRDVENFSTPDHSHFLSNTWNLLPESNVNLRFTKDFRISDYLLALKKTTGFFDNLDPETIFLSFQDKPSLDELSEMTENARANINISQKYMHCKLLSISVLSALAEETGGDAPIAMFMGDLPEQGCAPQSIEDYLPAPSINHDLTVDEKVFRLLKDGRERTSTFDLKHSPLAAFLYGLIGDEGLERSLKYLMTPLEGAGFKKLLGSLPKVVVGQIASACAEIAATRAKKLNRIVQEYSL